MAGELPFRITVYDKSFQRQGWIGAYDALSVRPRHNLVGTSEVTIPATHDRATDMLTPGARVVIEYEGAFLMSGPVWRAAGDNAGPERTLTFTVEDDFRILGQMLGWPNPTGTISQQGAADAYHTVTGPAETVVKSIVGANATRLGLPLAMGTDLGRGDSITVSTRMHPLPDRLFPLVEQAGLGVTVRHDESAGQLVLDVYEPVVRTRIIAGDTDETTGVLARWSFTQDGPTATRVVVGGSGEGTAREFAQVTNSGVESLWGTKVEVFRDARDTDDPSAMTARGEEALAEGAPTNGLTLELAETATFRYGRTFELGDVVTIRPAPGLEITDVVREVALTHTVNGQDGGLRVSPVVGDNGTVSPFRTLMQSFAALRRRARDQDARS